MRTVVALALAFVTAVGCVYAADEAPAWNELAEKALREAAEKAEREKASVEAAAQKAAESAAEDAVRSAAAAAAKAAAEAAAKEAAEATAKEILDAKAEREEADARAKEAKDEERAKLSQIDTRVFRLNHAAAVEVAEKLNEMWNGEFGQVWKVTRMAVPFEESNSVMITAPRMILESCAKAIAGLDVEAPQVYIEARFVELGNTASHKVGIDWSMLGGMKGTMNLGGGLQYTSVGEAVNEYTRSIVSKNEVNTYNINGAPGKSNGKITYLNGTLNFSEMYLVLKALDATEDTKTFSNPKIIVSSGKKAVVDMTTKYPNVNIAAKKTINNNNESVDLDMKMSSIPGEDKFMFAKEAFFSWGIELEVTPRIGTNGLINVMIVPTISQLDTAYGDGGFVTAGTAGGTVESPSDYSARYPIIEVKRLVTEFNMESGSTAVIGGLSKTVETQRDTGIPVLRSIPWIGPRLFGSMERVKEQREIIVFVTVGLVNPRAMSEDAGLPKNAILGRQYTKGQKLEPGDRPEKNMEGFESLDLRSLEEQARDPLQQQPKKKFQFGDYIPFTKDPNYKSKE